MKRIFGMVLLLLAFAAVVAGCSRETVPLATEETGPVTVTSVDELLSALAPGAEIQLAEGSYTLSGAADYGAEKEDGVYFWEPVEDGYRLVIRGIQGLVIRGSSQETTVLETGANYSAVLGFEECMDVTMENFSINAVPEYQGCCLSLYDCSDIVLENMSLSSSGMMGIRVENSQRITLSDSGIRDCVHSGIDLHQTDGLKVENCIFEKIGSTEFGNARVFRMGESRNVKITGCDISGNTVDCLIDCYPCDNVVFEKNTFRGNRVQTAALDVDGGLIFDNNVMEDNLIPAWFPTERATVLDGIGKSWNGEMLEWYYNPPKKEENTTEQEQIHVATVDEFLAAIGPNRKIILDAPLYDFSTARDYGTGWNDYYYWTEEFDGPNLVISDLENMTICSAAGDVTGCVISAVPRYAHVLSFLRCSGITLSGFTAGHTVEPGYCMGGVLNFRECDNILVDSCGLYGCGILGIQAERSGVFTVKNCDIYECSYGGIHMSEVSDVVIEKCTFRDLGGDSMSFYDCKNVTVNGKTVSGNSNIS